MALNLKINGQAISALAGQSILEVARNNNIFLPSLCSHPDLEIKANCRVCLVEILGRKRLATACSTVVEEGMEVLTDSPLVISSRNLNLELLFAEHIEKCPTCTLRFNCTLLDLARRYKIKIARFKDRKGKRKTYKFANAVEIDGSQCIDCRNCVEACSKIQKIDYLEVKGKGVDQKIAPVAEKNIDCIYCGQCALHCPVASAQEQDDTMAVEKILIDKKKVVVAQFAPSVRAAIGEEFSLPYDSKATGRTVAALKKLGFSHVFDVNFSADITTMVEAEELLERLNDKQAVLPLITSCCPAWVKYAEFFHPELLAHLTTSRSPQIHLGGVIKTYFAKKMKIDPRKIIVVSIMPCTAKKFESRRAELKVKGMWPVDYVLTTREFAYLLKKKRIDFAQLKPELGDELLTESSGAAAIYGASGGVMESALRSAASLLCANSKVGICSSRIDFQEVRGVQDFKEATIDIAGKKLKVAVINGIGAMDKVLPRLKKYQYIEVMACPGGCLGGGGQPLPTTAKIRRERMAALYQIDINQPIRKAHENKGVQEVLEWVKDNKLGHQVLHTKYKARNK